ncbi:MAG: 30S ribosome-binding factor RbfA [Clostridia bacterium]|nr:30S ribosome-binding factor RbfA [Clostridia bacterium]MBR7082408.1 30S ribosome-binding factor RbfA [Clostridia bacterium]
MPKYRRERINDEVTRVIGEALREVKDPRVSSSMITVTQSRVSGDLKYARIFFSVLGNTSPEGIKEVKKGLQSAQGFLRRKIAEGINLRITPELSFEYDDSIAHGAHIEQLIKEANIPAESPAEDEQ